MRPETEGKHAQPCPQPPALPAHLIEPQLKYFVSKRVCSRPRTTPTADQRMLEVIFERTLISELWLPVDHTSPTPSLAGGRYHAEKVAELCRHNPDDNGHSIPEPGKLTNEWAVHKREQAEGIPVQIPCSLLEPLELPFLAFLVFLQPCTSRLHVWARMLLTSAVPFPGMLLVYSGYE